MTFLRLGAACVVTEADGRVLLSQRADLKTWTVPGGRLDRGETLAACALREVSEETGITAEIVRPVGLYYAPGWQRLSVLFLGRRTGGELLGETHETLANEFFAPDALAGLAIPERNLLRLQDARSGDVLLRSYPFNRREYARLRRHFALRYVQNLLAGRPEPRYPRFDVQAVAIINHGEQVLASHGNRLPGVMLDGTAPPWAALASSLKRRFGIDVAPMWRGLWQDTTRDRITFVFSAEGNITGDSWVKPRNLNPHHRAFVQRTREQAGVWLAGA